MKKKHVLFILMLLVTFSFISCQSVNKDTRIISPQMAALVVASKSAPDDLMMDEKPSDIIEQDTMSMDSKTEAYDKLDALDDSGVMTEETRDEDIQTAKIEEYKEDIQISGIKEVKKEDKVDTLSELLNRFENQLVYTIQTGSYVYLANAQDQFNSLKRRLNNKELAFLRIEEIGKYYAVRLGIFDNYDTAKNFLHFVEPRLAEAIILEANIKEKRLIWFMLD